MGQRKSREEMNLIKEKYNVLDAYSWSRYNTWKRDIYEYFLKYILRVKEDRSNSIYGVGGGFLHDLKEDYYLGKLNKEDMPNMYLEEMNKLELIGFRFDRSNKEKNDKISVKYVNCNHHFLENFSDMVQKDMKLEEFIEILVGKFLFIGYIDACGIETRDGIDKMIITDFKTSSLYKGEKVLKERGQLLLYAYGKMQQGWKLQDIIIRWLFTKYVDVDVPHKDGFRTRTIERNEIGSKLIASVRAQMKKVKLYKEEEIDQYVDILIATKSLDSLPVEIFNFVDEVELTGKGELKKAFINKVRKSLLSIEKYDEDYRDEIVSEMIMTNSIDCVPDEVRSLYTIRDCFVEIPFTQEDIDELKDDIIKFIVDSNRLKFQYEETKDESLFYQEVSDENSYFMANLSGYSPKIHKPYADYLEKRKLEKGHDDEYEDDNSKEVDEMIALYKELGIDIED